MDIAFSRVAVFQTDLDHKTTHKGANIMTDTDTKAHEPYCPHAWTCDGTCWCDDDWDEPTVVIPRQTMHELVYGAPEPPTEE